MMQVTKEQDYTVNGCRGESITCVKKISKKDPSKHAFLCMIEQVDYDNAIKGLWTVPLVSPCHVPGAWPKKKDLVGKFDDVIVRPTSFKTTSGKLTTIPAKGSDDIARCIVGMNGTKKTLACYSPELAGEDMDPYVMGGSYHGPGSELPLTFKEVLALKP